MGLLAGAAVVLLVALVVTGTIGASDGAKDYRVAAVFDTAKSMVPGQQVKIAGAVVGRVEEIGLVPGPKARMVLEVEHRFGPFRADARCAIKPEGLISENFVECDPGRARAALAADASGLPEVPLARTTVPVSLQDVVDVFALPTSQRLGVIVSELGIAGAGRGRDVNDVLRRANPALLSTHRALGLLATQRDELGDAVDQTDRVLASLARDDQSVRRFVDRAADVTETTAARRVDLAETVRRLPAMLRAARPGLEAVDDTARQATPLLRELRAAAPGLQALDQTAPAFARAGRPALASVRAVARTARPAIKAARPTVRRLRASTGKLAAVVPDIDRFMVSFRDTGGIEGTLRVFYSLATLASSYDGTSHLINFIANLAPNCLAAQQAGQDSPGCSRRWDSEGNATIPINVPACGPTRPSDLWRNAYCDKPRPPIGTLPVTGGTPARSATTAKAKPPAAAAAPDADRRPGRRPAPAPQATVPTLPGILDDVTGVLGGVLGGGPKVVAPPTSPDRDQDDGDAVLDFLLG